MTITLTREEAQQVLDAMLKFGKPIADQIDEEVYYAAAETLRARLSAPEPDAAYGYASRLAEAIYQKHYRQDSPEWKPLDDTLGVLTQIDNMTCRLVKAQPEPDREKLFGVIHLDKDAPLTPEDRKQLRLGLMACLLEDGVLAKLGMLLNRYERTIEHLEAKPEPEQTRSEKMREAGITRRPNGWSKEDEPEPVAIVNEAMGGIEWLVKYSAEFEDKPLYFSDPPQREWQGLTDEERKEVLGSLTVRVTGHLQGTASTADYAKAIEAKLREKNGG